MPNFLIPENEPDNLRTMQRDLLDKIEKLLGGRDKKYNLGTPHFESTGPFIRVVPKEWAGAILSRNAANFWPAAIWELSHECVHLLDPTVGKTNYLEEGVAVVFQERITPTLAGMHHEVPESEVHYVKAKQLVKQLPGGAFSAAKKLRAKYGALRDIEERHLRRLFPNLDKQLAEQLSAEFCSLKIQPASKD